MTTRPSFSVLHTHFNIKTTTEPLDMDNTKSLFLDRPASLRVFQLKDLSIQVSQQKKGNKNLVNGDKRPLVDVLHHNLKKTQTIPYR